MNGTSGHTPSEESAVGRDRVQDKLPSSRGHAPLDEPPLGRVLGYNVWKGRLAQGLTKERFSLMAGITRPTLDKVEYGRADPKLSVVSNLAAALGTTALALLSPPADPRALDLMPKSKREWHTESGAAKAAAPGADARLNGKPQAHQGRFDNHAVPPDGHAT